MPLARERFRRGCARWLLFPGLFALAACRTHPLISGLQPLYPEAWSNSGQIICERIHTLQPTMRWEAFPGRSATNSGQTLPDFRNVTYDLRIWRVEADCPADVVYERISLPSPSHNLESPLLPKTRYCWSVRPRFQINGQSRVADWNFSVGPVPMGQFPERLGFVPCQNYLRFETPESNEPEKARETISPRHR